MKAKSIFMVIFILTFTKISAQKQKHFVPLDEPFKTFESPKFKFDSVFHSKPNAFFIGKESNHTLLNRNEMPIFKPENHDMNMPILRPTKNIEYTLLIQKPFEMDEIIEKK